MHLNGTTSVLLVRANTTFAKLVQRIHSLFKGPFVLNILIEDDGDIVEIVNDQDLANAFALAHGNTLVVRLEDRYAWTSNHADVRAVL